MDGFSEFFTKDFIDFENIMSDSEAEVYDTSDDEISSCEADNDERNTSVFFFLFFFCFCFCFFFFSCLI